MNRGLWLVALMILTLPSSLGAQPGRELLPASLRLGAGDVGLPPCPEGRDCSFAEFVGGGPGKAQEPHVSLSITVAGSSLDELKQRHDVATKDFAEQERRFQARVTGLRKRHADEREWLNRNAPPKERDRSLREMEASQRRDLEKLASERPEVSVSAITSAGRISYFSTVEKKFHDFTDASARVVVKRAVDYANHRYYFFVSNPSGNHLGGVIRATSTSVIRYMGGGGGGSGTVLDAPRGSSVGREVVLAKEAGPYADRAFQALVARVNGGGPPAEARAPQAPETPRPTGGRLVVRRVGGDFGQGVWLDGQSPVEFEAMLTDAQGKPLAGVPVELTVVDRDLPRRGQLSYLGARATDAQGRVRGRYLPPRVEERELARRAPALGFQARALPKGAPPIDANENVLAHALVPAFLRVSRDPYVPVELSAGDKRLGEAVTDASGTFQLDFAVERSPAPPQLALPDPIVFTDYESLTKGRLARARVDLSYLADPTKYGYQVGPLLSQLDERFPERLAAAATGPAIDKELDRAHRVGLLIAALWKTHDLVTHSAGEWAESLTALVESLLDVFNPLDKLKSDGTAAEMQKWAELARDRTPVKAKIVQRVLAGLATQLRKVAESEPLRDAAEKLYEATAREVTRGALTGHLLEEKKGGDEEPRWKEPIVDALMARYRDLAQKELTRAAQLWEADRIPVGGRQGPLFATRYQEIAAHKDRVTARQLRLDLYKANMKLGMDVVDNGVKIIATGYGTAPVAEGVELIERGLKTVNVGLAAFQGYLWLRDYGVGMRGISQFAQAALAHCIGAAC